MFSVHKPFFIPLLSASPKKGFARASFSPASRQPDPYFFGKLSPGKPLIWKKYWQLYVYCLKVKYIYKFPCNSVSCRVFPKSTSMSWAFRSLWHISVLSSYGKRRQVPQKYSWVMDIQSSENKWSHISLFS